MARPEINFVWQTLDACIALGATKEECAGFMEISHDTIDRRLKAELNMTFKEYKEMKFAKTILSLKKKQLDKALAGDTTMLIWLGKNLLGQTDKFAESSEVAPSSITLKYAVPGHKYTGHGPNYKPDVEVNSENLPTVVDDVDSMNNDNKTDDDTFAGDS